MPDATEEAAFRLVRFFGFAKCRFGPVLQRFDLFIASVEILVGFGEFFEHAGPLNNAGHDDPGSRDELCLFRRECDDIAGW